MAESYDPQAGKGKDDELDPSVLVRYAEEPPEVEEDDQPRRAASARFIVDAEVGSEAMLRDAMDPANQSLADALRLSFRVLQAVIVVLVVLFLASGFKTVEDGHSGVRTLWGRIVEPLSPGPKFSIWPYPAGEFFTFKAENREVGLGEYFMMASNGRPRETIMEQTEVSTPLNPGRDGSLITADGDLAHIEMTAKYEIDQPEEFVHRVNDAEMRRNADELVRMALRRAAVHVASGMTVVEFSEPARVPEIKEKLRIASQEVLDDVKAGIRVIEISNANGIAPFAIQKAMQAVQEAEVTAGDMVENARKDAAQKLQNMAGANYQDIINLIDAYEDALDGKDEAKSDQLLAQITAKLESEEVSGEVTQIINRARSYKAQIESTLGTEYQRFAGLLPAYKANPKAVIRQQWLEAYQQIMSKPDIEVLYMAEGGSMSLALSGSSEIQNLRTDNRRRQRETAFNQANYTGPYVARGGEMSIDSAGRQLKLNPKTGKLEPMGSGN